MDSCLDGGTIRAIILTGTGEKLFSSGADIKDFDGLLVGKDSDVNGSNVFLKIEKYPKPVIAAMQGSAFGGGLELALSCHLKYLADSALLGLPEVKLGLIPGWGSTQRLPRLIGRPKALEMILTGNPIGSSEAAGLGLVNKVVPRQDVVAEAEKMAETLAHGAPLAIKLILDTVTAGLEKTLDDGIKEVDAAYDSRDGREGIEAFYKKRCRNLRGNNRQDPAP